MINFILKAIIVILSPIIFIITAALTIIAGILFGFLCIALYPFIKINKIIEEHMKSFEED